MRAARVAAAPAILGRMAITYRTLTEADWDDWVTANARGFLEEPSHTADWSARVRPLVEFDRAIGAFDGAELVGQTAAISFRMSMPGGDLPTAGVTSVTVSPTHRRRGILTELMRRQLDGVRERGEPLAALGASESVIYARFGYGMAAQAHDFRLDRRHAAFRADAPDPDGSVRFVPREAALERWPALHERARALRPGMMTRDSGYWSRLILPEKERLEGGFSAPQLVEYAGADGPAGYAIYQVKSDWPDHLPAGTLRVHELTTLDGPAEAALWRYLCGVDLIETVAAPNRPPDDPLPWLLADPRRLRRGPHDSLWVRLLDVPRALEGRAYAAEGRLTLDVRDPFGPWAEGRFELRAEGGGAACRALERAAAPDIALGADALAAILLGGVPCSVLARAGRAEGAPEALRLADALFAWHTAPWCVDEF